MPFALPPVPVERWPELPLFSNPSPLRSAIVLVDPPGSALYHYFKDGS